jgi:hypothetical protein
MINVVMTFGDDDSDHFHRSIILTRFVVMLINIIHPSSVSLSYDCGRLCLAYPAKAFLGRRWQTSNLNQLHLKSLEMVVGPDFDRTQSKEITCDIWV